MKQNLFSLLEKYDVAGPRYTSYPTVPAWTEAVGENAYRENLKKLKPEEPLSLYFHLPFCENLCHFCGCMTVITTKHEKSREYTNQLLKEIDRVTQLIAAPRHVTQIHFGGGSPNFLKPEELRQIMESVRQKFEFSPDIEIAIEMHPRTSTHEFCEEVGRLGFNRISLGVQDLDPKVQKMINRHQTYDMTAEMVALLRKLGTPSFNFDLIYGLPGQSMGGWEKTLQQVLDLRPHRLAVYSYAHVPWLKPYQRSFEDKDLPTPELKLRLFEKAYQTLTTAGYQPIGMDHFALPDDELALARTHGSLHRNFMGYSTRSDAHQIGFGVSAISYVGGDYFQNQKELPAYNQAIQNENGLATFRGFLLSTDDKIRRDLITRIMCLGQVFIQSFDRQWGISFRKYFENELENLIPMIEDELVRIDGQKFKVIGLGFLFLRNIAMMFDRYLKTVKSKASNPVFSKTI